MVILKATVINKMFSTHLEKCIKAKFVKYCVQLKLDIFHLNMWIIPQISHYQLIFCQRFNTVMINLIYISPFTYTFYLVLKAFDHEIGIFSSNIFHDHWFPPAPYYIQFMKNNLVSINMWGGGGIFAGHF